ncbi:hypothetical protein [Xenorhabdus bovienii]|uniref:Uncharacterized protein n=1 Tax=Xenorhabdus bovienii str. kraussei Becker Underwood TaxID=1398204 RepID=A0A077PPW0_XENBV|nr:hypothetical protein [Xenorhabdus bovienii]CDH26350.1 hypothetical protein XBKB1_590003 [Xenorhabdus bovienii str. kraussei Becker Underwood]
MQICTVRFDKRCAFLHIAKQGIVQIWTLMILKEKAVEQICATIQINQLFALNAYMLKLERIYQPTDFI